ncbi:MAG: DUF4912 domain-containing protein [Verrucomicrobia bacterium]|nr:DUF4912 domain-containing protein [Verrucomicrobiota bacterium]MBI3869496.1 DUF4912 domain-containing protein [Verrucomicrobiota bacterium]
MKSDRSKKAGSSARASAPTPAASRSKLATKSAAKPAAKATAKPASKSRSQPAPQESEAFEIPSILLEGDAAAAIDRSGPGERFMLGPQSLGAPSEALDQALPDAYGTRKLLLIARDPHWLYAHWDFTADQLRECNAKSADKHLVLRIHKDGVGETPFAEIHVHPESRHWFVHVARGSTRFLGELGYYASQKQRRWTRVALSEPTLTPPDSLSDDRSVRFATLPMEVSMRQLVSLVKSAAREHEPLSGALRQLRESGHASLPSAVTIAGAPWTPEQERALAELLSIDDIRRVWIGSLEITELIRKQIAQELSSAAAAQFSTPGLPSSLGVSSLSSPFGGIVGDRKRGFWFNVNAELIIYGATEPDAQVTIGGRPIKLRPDGSFSYRFSLPDGQFELPAIAVSSDKTDGRSARLRFSRQTHYTGDVGTHPQDPTLRPPRPEHVH